jgi:hypothetical protein
VAITHDAGERVDFRQPTAVLFPFEVDRERHGCTVAFGWLPNTLHPAAISRPHHGAR